MAFCSNCGTKMEDGAKFCPSCGTAAGGNAPAVAKSANEKVGNIRKCPACGADVPPMTAVCSSCGHAFTNVQVSSTVGAFFEKLDAINQEVYEREAAKEAKGLSGGFGGMMEYGLNMLSKGQSAGSGAKRQIAMIEGYPIPNSKEDILEFMLLASSRYKGIKKPFALTATPETTEAFQLDDAWRTKCNQAYTKAKITFGSDKDALAQVEAIIAEVEKTGKKGKK